MTATPLEVLFNIVLYVLICVLLWRAFSIKNLSRVNLRISSLLILVFLLFAFWGGDYFHYIEGFDVVKNNPLIETSFEDIYYWIVSIVPSYFFFRLVVWGGCFFFFLKTLSLLKIPRGIGLLAFTAFSLLRLSYARVSLAMAIMYLGLAFIYSEHRIRKPIIWIIGGCIILASFFFHKSAYFGIAMIVSSILLSNIKKSGSSIAIITALLFGAFFIVSNYIDNFMMMAVDPGESNLSVEIGQKYLNRDESEVGWGGQIRNVGEMIPYYLGLLVYVKLQIKGDFKKFPKSMIVFSNLFLIIVLASSVFMLDFGLNTIFLYHRFMRFNLIPLAVFMSFCYSNGYEKKLVKATFIIAILVALFTLYYSFAHT